MIFKLYKEHCNSYNLCLICQVFKITLTIQNFLEKGIVLHKYNLPCKLPYLQTAHT
jgi:hypothetical protein